MTTKTRTKKKEAAGVSPVATEATAAAARATIEGGTFKVPLSLLRPHEHNPRDPNAGADPELASLAESMLTQGLLEPILVRRVADEREAYVVLSGHRRWKAAAHLDAAGHAGWVTIDAREVKTDDAGALAIVLTANQQRLALDPVREGASLAELVRLAGGIKEAAARIGRTVPYVAERIGLPGLSKGWQKRFHERPWSLWPLRAWALLAGMVPEQQDAFAASSRVTALLDDPMLDPKTLEGELADWVRVLGKAPFPIEDPALVPQAGACAACPKQSQHRQGLFDTGEPQDLRAARCGDRACWELKSRRFLQTRLAAAKKEHGEDVVVTLPESHVGRAPQGVRVLQAHAYQKAKKGEKGAVPAISATAKGTEVAYVKVRKTSGSSGRHKERDRGPGLADLRLRWEGAKLVAAGEALGPILRSIDCPPVAGFLAIVLVEGWEAERGFGGRRSVEKELDAMLRLETPEKMLAAAWKVFLKDKHAPERIVGVYANFWNGQTTAGAQQTVQQAKEQLRESAAKVALLGADPKAVEAAIAKALESVPMPEALRVAEKGEAKEDPPAAAPKARKPRGKAAAAGDTEQAQVDEARRLGTEEQDHASDEALGRKPRARKGR